MYTVSDWWEEAIADDGEYEATFSFMLAEIPEDALKSDYLSYRREQAADWLDANLSSFDSRSSYCVLDWHEDGYVHGQAGPAAAMTDSKDKTTITNVYQHVGDDFYSEVGPAATVFHELLHDYSASHSDAAVDTSDTASIMYSELYDDGHGEDDFCFWVGDKADKRSDWTTFCTETSVRSYIDDHA
ncbi:hypothetical protein C479_10005 [Halovivax asiaticus JCM 14624]|uniref:Uncharacterized protein n=2 Tax=Halovivax asiaticus TaxID=332953 RepID=M0BHW6_9EURY|nr:hypothetical protein C479_10005 [Halovivax asiaticus JCM 14624]